MQIQIQIQIQHLSVSCMRGRACARAPVYWGTRAPVKVTAVWGSATGGYTDCCCQRWLLRPYFHLPRHPVFTPLRNISPPIIPSQASSLTYSSDQRAFNLLHRSHAHQHARHLTSSPISLFNSVVWTSSVRGQLTLKSSSQREASADKDTGESVHAPSRRTPAHKVTPVVKVKLKFWRQPLPIHHQVFKAVIITDFSCGCISLGLISHLRLLLNNERV